MILPLTPELRRQRQMDLCEFEANVVYKASYSIARAVTKINFVSEKKINTPE